MKLFPMFGDIFLPGDPRKSSDVSRRLEAERMSQSAWSYDIRK